MTDNSGEKDLFEMDIASSRFSSYWSSSIIMEASKMRGKILIADMLKGNTPVSADNVLDYDDYDAIYKVRHDLIHSVICDKLNLPFGEKTVKEIIENNKISVRDNRYFDDVANQTPDYFSVTGGSALIIEITVSVDPMAKRRKAAKYALLTHFLKRNKIQVEYRILVIHPQNVYINRLELIKVHKLDDGVIDFIKEICDNSNNLLYEIHLTEQGSTWFRHRHEVSTLEIDTGITPDDVIQTFKNFPEKPLSCLEDVQSILKSKDSYSITKSDSDFIDSLVDSIDEVESRLMTKEDFNRLSFTNEMEKKSRNKTYRSSLPIPFIEVPFVDSSKRDTNEDFSLLTRISARMMMCDDLIISKFGQACSNHLDNFHKMEDNDQYLFTCKLSPEEKYLIALDGPGRKKYIRSRSEEHIKREEEHNGFAMSPYMDVDDVEKISFFLSQKDEVKYTGDVLKDSKIIECLTGPGINYIRICQTIYREVNINSMRYNRRKQFVLKPTGAEGIYVLLFKGSKLRCGELANICWFKIIVDNEFLRETSFFPNHWIFKRLSRDKTVSHSGWLSADVHRFDHYIRCYDKILMAYMSMISIRNRSEIDLKDFEKVNKEDEMIPSKSVWSTYNSDTTNALGLIMMIYLEDKRSTSKMLQNIRYLVMSGLSMFPRFKSVFEKFSESIRSPLQLYLLNRSLDYVPKIMTWRRHPLANFGNIKYDSINHIFLDSHGGSKISLPRPLISGGSEFADFPEILSEMYFTMLFNKNQDDPTHASFQILEKIIEGEDNYERIKSLGKQFTMGYNNDISDQDFATEVIKLNRVHSFSKRAIEIGSILLRHKNGDPLAEHITQSMTKFNVNKPLSEFATFKSSSILENEYYEPSKYIQNPRRKCVEGVLELLEDEKITRSLDVVRKYKDEKTGFHVFKKNQIGGVREILILPITNRIRINVLETISRNLCQLDKREMLTHGPTKNEAIKACLYTSKKYEHKRAPIHLTFDKSKWGPSFVPIQFLYLFTRFREKLGSVFNFIFDLLIRHQNKTCALPERLIRSWINDKEKKHSDTLLQRRKDDFLRTNKITFDNCSNMGQGILHYTSSLLHLALISLRDELYKRACEKRGLSHIDHEDLLSSDDSYTIFCPELNKGSGSKFISMKLRLFLRCQEICERLFSCRTSTVKSSINPMIGEFNSLFISNMSFIPTLLKFCLASVHPTNTDSFFRMVKESYSSCRQIVENGGSLELYLMSSILNKNYCESIYHTYKDGVNDLSSRGIDFIPYHLGHYPIFNPALMICFGPEYYNYFLYKEKFSIMNQQEKKLFINSHKMIKGGLVETMAEFEEGDTVLGGLLRIEAAIGPTRMLQKLQSESPLNREDLDSMILKDPILIIRDPKTHSEVVFKTVQKLYTTGSAEALKTLSASIFYGRVSATVSANAFYIPNGDVKKQTYSECLKRLIDEENETVNFDDHIRFMYPKHKDYDIFINEAFSLPFQTIRNPLEIQTIQKLSTHKIYTKLVNSISTILGHQWLGEIIPINMESKMGRDLSIIQEHYPLIKDSLEETLEQFSGTEMEKTKGLLLLILKLFSLRDRSFKGVIYGFGSEDIRDTFKTLVDKNLTLGSTSYSTTEIKENLSKSHYYEKIFCAFNQHILSFFTNKNPKVLLWEEVTEDELNIFLQDKSQSLNLKKRIFMSALNASKITNIMEWSNKTQLILHKWVVRQKYHKGIYTGNYKILLFSGVNQLTVKYDSKTNKYKMYKHKIDDPELLYEFLNEFSSIINSTLNEVLDKTNNGKWVIDKNKALKAQEGKFDIIELSTSELVTFNETKLFVDDEKMTLQDEFGVKLFRIETGLIESRYVPKEDFDFNVFGLSFVKICAMRAFTNSFNLLYLSKKSSVNCLDDLSVDKPMLSEETVKRLNLNNWDLIGETKTDDFQVGISSIDVFEDLIDIDFAELQETIELDSPEEDLLNFLTTSNLLHSMKTTLKIQQNRKIFNTIKNLKYELICHNILHDMKINKSIISSISKIISGKNKIFILYSLLFLYNKTQYLSGYKSPENVIFQISSEFSNTFNLDQDEIEFDF
jgi:hypothetical protein